MRVMDSPFGGTPQSAYAISGIEAAVEAAGGEMHMMSRPKYTCVDIPQGKDLTQVEIYPDILEADLLINVPIAKHHGSTRLTLGEKNLMGTILDRDHDAHEPHPAHRRPDQPGAPGADRDRCGAHPDRTMARPAATWRTSSRLDTVIASRDIVAADAYATTLFGLTGSGYRLHPGKRRHGVGYAGPQQHQPAGDQPGMSWTGWRRVRQTVQILFFAFYIYLIFAVVQQRLAPALCRHLLPARPALGVGSHARQPPVDPEPGIGAGHSWADVDHRACLVRLDLPPGQPAGVGILPQSPQAGELQSRPGLRLVKYFLLATSLALALFGGLTLLVLDPIAIFTRTLTTAILPAIFYAVNSVETALYHVGFLTPALDGFEGAGAGQDLTR